MAEVTIKSYLDNAKLVKEQLPSVIIESLLKNEDRIVAMNQEQLYDGKTTKGTDIMPLYSQDTFFKTQAQAQGYIKWKQKITPNSKRNPDAPNLIINGFHYSMIGLLKKGRDIVIGVKSSNQITSSIEGKYKNIYGLNPQNQEKINNEIIIPAINEFLTKTL